tara:strand:+ start:1297 stop:2568 length:1272 start_codon:yes stop_codon:yes gene_type:complete
MNHFVFKNEKFDLNDIVLVKNKQRELEKLMIKNIKKRKNFYEVELKFIEYNYDKNKIIKIFPEKNKPFIKKYFQYNESKEIFCKKMKKTETVYCFECSFCETIHKHNYLGQNDCKCSSIYSPYKNCGYILILDELNFNNFNDYILHNYKLYLRTILSSTTISWYIRYIKQFYQGSLCNNYGVNVFPFITYNTIKDISIKFNNESKIKNLITSLKKFIVFMKTKELMFHSNDFQSEITELTNFYKESEIPEKSEESEIPEKPEESEIPEKPEESEISEKIKESEISEKIKESEIPENIEESEIPENIEESEIPENREEIIMPRIKDINLIKLDIEPDIKKHISKKIKTELKYLILTQYNKPMFYHKIQIADKYTVTDYLWITIQYYNNFIWGISETYTDGVDFINYKIDIMNEKNRELIDEDDY